MYWKNSPGTRITLQAISERIEEIKEHMSNGNLLSFDTPEHLSREYAKLTGEIVGLGFIKDFIESAKEDEDDDHNYAE